MVAISELWLPILVAAVVVFIVSSVIHMVLGYHKHDFAALPNEDAAQDALRALKIAPGEYMVPKAWSMEQMKSPEFKAKFERGPVVLLNVVNARLAMGKNLLQWFVYLLVVGFCCAYIAGRELSHGAPYLGVFRLVGFSAFMAYALALPQASIWYHHNWRATLLTMLDGLVFAALTGGVFGWLWPR
jgi:hypothetical protein